MRDRAVPLALAMVLAAVAWAAPVSAQIVPADARFVQPGDKIRVHLWQDPELSGEFAVDESGYVSLPLVGLRRVIGRPGDEVKRQLVEEFGRQLRNQAAQITILRRVRVLGAVGQPGLYFADGTMTLGDVVAEAGGVDPEGDEDDIRVQRGSRVFRTSLDRGLAEFPVESGDVVTVQRSSWFARNASVVIGAFISAVTIVVTRR